MQNYISPILYKDEKVIFIVIDCLRLDQWKAMEKILCNFFKIKTDSYLSIIPTATPFSRNSIFSGMFPNEISKNFPDKWKSIEDNINGMNSHESDFLRFFLDCNGFKNKTMKYTKILTYKDGDKFSKRINEYKNIDLLALVINFVDILGHSRSESNILKEMIPNESAYRQAICTWLQSSWLMDVFEVIGSWETTVILTSDHGSIRVNKPIQIKGDRSTSDGLRYKYGKNLYVSSKNGFKINSLDMYKLPVLNKCSEYVISLNNYYYLYPNNFNKFISRFDNSFQHGGISIEEMIVPIVSLKAKQ